MTTNCNPMKCSHADHAYYVDDDWRCHARTGPGHMTNHGIFAYKTLVFQRVWITVTRSITAQTLKILTDAYTSRIVRVHAKRCYWAVILERIESPTLESHESLECFVCLVCQVCQCLSWKTSLVVKSKIWNLKPNCIYSMLYAICWTTLLSWD